MATRVVELFAGVGGFRIEPEGSSGNSTKSKFKVIYSNQWEPSTKRQHAAEVYVERWVETIRNENVLEFHGDGEVFVNKNIAEIDTKDIPNHDLIVGGFLVRITQ